MTTPIAEALRIVAARLHPSADAVQLRRLAGMVERLEYTLDEIAADGQTDARVPREGNVLAFKRR